MPNALANTNLAAATRLDLLDMNHPPRSEHFLTRISSIATSASLTMLTKAASTLA
jgi:hypothetical protein